MKKTFVAAFMVGSCMLTSETANAQDSSTQGLLTASQGAASTFGQNRRRRLEDEDDGTSAKAKKARGEEDTNNEEGEEKAGDEEPQEEKEEEQEPAEEEEEPEEKDEEEPETAEEPESAEEADDEPETAEDEPEEKDDEPETADDEPESEEKDDEPATADDDEPEEKDDADDEGEEKEEGDDEGEEKEEGDGEEREGADADDDDNPRARVEEEGVGPDGEQDEDAESGKKKSGEDGEEQEENAEPKDEAEDQDKEEPEEQEEEPEEKEEEEPAEETPEEDDPESQESQQEKEEPEETPEEEPESEEKDDEPETADDEPEEKDDEAETADDEPEEKDEADDDEGEEKDEADEGEEKEEGDEPEEREDQEPVDDDDNPRARVEEESVGPGEDQPSAPKSSTTAGGKYEGDIIELDEENDPTWYRSHMSTYPCYKLTEGALYNFQLLKNLDTDWHTAGADAKNPSQVFFNLCHYTDTNDCSGNKEDAFAYRTNAQDQCEMLTSDSPQAEISADVSRDNDGSDQRGVRIMRAGGDVCPQDDSRMLSFVLDVWCDEDKPRNPSDIKSAAAVPDEDADPCIVYVELSHSAGCPDLDLQPILTILGSIMIFFGVVLSWFGLKVQKTFLRFIGGFATFLLTLGVFFKLNWLAMLDPTEPDENKSAFLCFCAFLLAGIATFVAYWAIKKFIRFGPTLIGFCAGFWFSIYLIAAINGVGGMFVTVPSTAGASTDIVGPVWGAVIEMCVSLLGAMVGYNYSFVFILLIQTFVSAYLIVRGSTLIMNLGFPNEIVLMQSVTSETNGLVKLPTAFYLYSLTILGLWGGSFYHQFNKAFENSKWEIDEEDD